VSHTAIIAGAKVPRIRSSARSVLNAGTADRGTAAMKHVHDTAYVTTTNLSRELTQSQYGLTNPGVSY
jgi:hypothetical protein